VGDYRVVVDTITRQKLCSLLDPGLIQESGVASTAAVTVAVSVPIIDIIYVGQSVSGDPYCVHLFLLTRVLRIHDHIHDHMIRRTIRVRRSNHHSTGGCTHYTHTH
jgi:hypothetical protein